MSTPQEPVTTIAAGPEVQETAADLMRPCTPKLRRGATLVEAAAAMLKEHVRQATVVDEADGLIGVIYGEELFDTRDDTIDSVVRPARMVIPASVASMDVIRMMEKAGCTRAVVVDGLKVVGLLTVGDVIERLRSDVASVSPIRLSTSKK